MAKTKTDAAASNISDVSRPNDSAPPENSKSVIITKRPLMRDPMMAAPAASGEGSAAEETPPKAKVVHEKLILPPSSSTLSPPSYAATEAPAPETPVAAAVSPAGPPNPPSASPAPESTDKDRSDFKQEPLSDEAAALKEADALAQRRVALDALIVSQKYYLPVDTVERKKARRVILAGAVVIILLGVTWADVSLDAGIVHLGGLKAPTHFFSN